MDTPPPKKQKRNPGRQPRQYTDEFKAGAARLVLVEGHTVKHVAKNLHLTGSALDTWVPQAKADAGRGPPGALTSDEKEELARLRRENKVLWMERDILSNNLAVKVNELAMIHDDVSLDSETATGSMHWHSGHESRVTAWVLTGDGWWDGTGWACTDLAPFSAADLDLDATTEIPFEASPGTGLEKRAIAVQATLYWQDDLSGPATTMESRALVYQKYQKCITAGLASDTYSSLPSTSDLQAAGHVDLDGDGDGGCRAASPRSTTRCSTSRPR